MQAIFFLVFLILGAVVCVILARELVERRRLPWREALVYFGLAADPADAPYSGPRARTR
jgi:hypothetical protein